MERLTNAEWIATRNALLGQGITMWDRAALLFDAGVTESAEWCADACRDAQSAYAKLENWPYNFNEERF